MIRFSFADDGTVMIDCTDEALIYERSLTLDEINKVGEWLSNRYNLKWKVIER